MIWLLMFVWVMLLLWLAILAMAIYQSCKDTRIFRWMIERWLDFVHRHEHKR